MIFLNVIDSRQYIWVLLGNIDLAPTRIVKNSVYMVSIFRKGSYSKALEAERIQHVYTWLFIIYTID